MKDKFYAIATLVAGIGFLVFSIVMLNAGDVQCGGSSMSSSDSCHTYSRNSGDGQTRTMDEQRHSNDREAWIGIAIGTAMGVGGAFWTRSEFRAKS